MFGNGDWLLIFMRCRCGICIENIGYSFIFVMSWVGVGVVVSCVFLVVLIFG